MDGRFYARYILRISPRYLPDGAHATRLDRVKGLEAGANDYLVKPFPSPTAGG